MKRISKEEKNKEKLLLKENEAHHNDLIKLEKENRKLDKFAPENSYISLKNVNKIYDNHVQAVYDFNLDVKKNEFVVFVGPSGCGKSTTLRMIAGLESITYGDLFMDKCYANNLLPKDRKIGMVFQSYALYPHMSVYENMAFSLAVKHVDKEIIDKKVIEAAKILEIEKYLDRKPNALSGGECQRVALGRAIVSDSDILLMDEPLSNLDAKLRVTMRSEIVRLHKAMNKTTIYVTHDQTEAMTMADRIVVMSKGHVQQIGTPEEIFNKPANVFVATFVGSPSMNILDVKSKDNKLYLDDEKTVFDMGEGFDEKINQFYRDEISKTKVELETYKTTLLNREKEKKYKKVVTNNQVRIDLLTKYINKEMDENILENMSLKKEELVKKYAEMAHSCEIIENFDTVLRDYLFEKGKIENPKIIEYLDKILKLDNMLNDDWKTLYLGIRPENIIETEANNSEVISTEIIQAELLGSEYFVHFMVNKKELIAKTSAKKKFNSNDQIKLTFDKEKIHIFDSITEKGIY